METSYFRELALNLRREGLTVKPETEDGLLPVELDGQCLCCVTEASGVRYREENAVGDSEALDSVINIAGTTAVYMRQMAAAPLLTAAGLDGDYRLLAEFNGVILAGHHTSHGTQFITWERDRKGTGVHTGHYHGFGADSYTAAKRDFALRSGLIQDSALFPQEQTNDLSQNSMI